MKNIPTEKEEKKNIPKGRERGGRSGRGRRKKGEGEGEGEGGETVGGGGAKGEGRRDKRGRRKN